MSQVSALISRNIAVLGKRTSIRLESQMWVALKEIAERERCSIHDLCSLIASRRKSDLSLTASIRIFLMLYFKAASTEDGHKKAGHGGLDRMIARLIPAQSLIGAHASSRMPEPRHNHNSVTAALPMAAAM